jgi:hypothetical protein
VLVGDGDVVDVDGLAHQGAGLGVGLVGLEEVGADAGAQVLGLADVDDLALGVLVEVAAGEGGDGADFGLEVHGRVARAGREVRPLRSSLSGSRRASGRARRTERILLILWAMEPGWEGCVLPSQVVWAGSPRRFFSRGILWPQSTPSKSVGMQ